MRPIVTDGERGLSVCCLLVMIVNPAKTAEPIEMPFGSWNRLGSKNHVLDAVHIPHRKGQFWEKREVNCKVQGHSAVRCTKATELIFTTYTLYDV